MIRKAKKETPTASAVRSCQWHERLCSKIYYKLKHRFCQDKNEKNIFWGDMRRAITVKTIAREAGKPFCQGVFFPPLLLSQICKQYVYFRIDWLPQPVCASVNTVFGQLATRGMQIIPANIGVSPTILTMLNIFQWRYLCSISIIGCRFANSVQNKLAKRQLYFPFMQWVGITPTHYLYKDRLLFVFRPAYAKTQIKSAYYRLIKATDRNLRLYSATERGRNLYWTK